MIGYENRMVAALRSRGAGEDVVTDARNSLRDLRQGHESLVAELGEPEAYAAALVPDPTPQRKIAFIVMAMVVSVVVLLSFRWAAESGVEPFASAGYLGPLVALGCLATGLLADFRRYLRTGHA